MERLKKVNLDLTLVFVFLMYIYCPELLFAIEQYKTRWK
jgi:hypothetical protein